MVLWINKTYSGCVIYPVSKVRLGEAKVTLPSLSPPQINPMHQTVTI